MRPGTVIIFVLLSLLPALSYANSASNGGASVSVRPTSSVKGDSVLLRDLAELNGFAPEEAERVGRIYLAKAPAPGETRRFPGRFLQKMLAVNKVAAKMSIPEQIEVRRDAHRVSLDDISSLYKEEVCRRTGSSADQVSLDGLNLKEELSIPEGEVDLKIDFNPTESFRGLTVGRLLVSVNDKPVRSLQVSATVERRGRAVVPVRLVAKGEVLRAEDLSYDEIPLSKAPVNLVTEMDDVVGQVALKPLSSGQPLTTSQVEAPLLVHRGDMVTLVIDSRGMRIETPGVAVQSGRKQELIKVVNTSSNKTLIGQVVAVGEVKVPF